MISLSSRVIDKFKTADINAAKHVMYSDFGKLSRSLQIGDHIKTHIGKMTVSVLIYCEDTEQNIDLNDKGSHPVKNSDIDLLNKLIDLISSDQMFQVTEILTGIANKHGYTLNECIVEILESYEK
jgi:hypothetical protein